MWTVVFAVSGYVLDGYTYRKCAVSCDKVSKGLIDVESEFSLMLGINMVTRSHANHSADRVYELPWHFQNTEYLFFD